MISCFLIDDDSDDQEFFSLALEGLKKNVELTIASNGIDALEKLQVDNQYEPDFIFIDMNMPRMSGKECVPELRKIERLNKTPIVLYSTFDVETGTAESEKSGASFFFTKPVSIAELSNVLSSIFERYEKITLS